MTISYKGEEASLFAGLKVVDKEELPPGGTKDQFLAKASNADFDVKWANPPKQEDVGVKTFNGRTGEVVPQTGDYTAEMVNARPNTWMPTTNDIGAVPTARTINGHALSSNITLTSSDVGAVSQERTINGQALSADVELVAEDVGALPDTTVIPTKTSELQNDSGYVTPSDIPEQTKTKYVTVTLSASAWSETNTQTVTVNGILQDETKQLIQPVPVSSVKGEYYDYGIICTSQGLNSLTFKADTIPSSDLTVYIVVQEVFYDY